MALPLFESWSPYFDSLVPPLYIWTGQDGGPTIDSDQGRRGGGCLVTNWQQGIYITAAAEATWVVGFAFMATLGTEPDGSGFYPNILQLEDGAGTVQLSLQLTETGAIRLSRGNQAATLAESVATMPPAEYHYIELLATIGNSGSAAVYLDGEQVIDFSGDTQQTGNATADTCRLGNTNGLSSPGLSRYDDVRIDAGDGVAPAGDIPIDRVFLSGAGAVTGWTPDSGNNWEQVNETLGDDGDTSYIEDATPATAEDSYTHEPASGSPIFGVQVRIVGRTTSGTDDVRPFVRIGGVNYYGTAGTLTTSYGCVRHVWETNPSTGSPWALAEVNEAEVGVIGGAA